jgi:hypothetical protein
VDIALTALLTAVAAAVIGPLMLASVEVRRRDRQIETRDEDLEEWIIFRHRQLLQRFHEIEEDANARGVSKGSSVPAGRVVVKTLLLYDYREELRQAHGFVRDIEAEERWVHRIARILRRRPLRGLTTPERAERLVDYWSEGTARNALSWGLKDILDELPKRATHGASDLPRDGGDSRP